jgi:hypothetical protein
MVTNRRNSISTHLRNPLGSSHFFANTSPALIKIGNRVGFGFFVIFTHEILGVSRQFITF